MKAFEHRHTVGFEETNLVGNVYYVNHVRWQGRCRELFLKQHASDVLEQLRQDLRLVTTHCSCDYLAELNAFDEIIIRLTLGGITQNRITLLFDYARLTPAGEERVARGEQQIVCMKATADGLVPTEVPQQLQQALRAYTE